MPIPTGSSEELKTLKDFIKRISKLLIVLEYNVFLALIVKVLYDIFLSLQKRVITLDVWIDLLLFFIFLAL